MLIMKRSFKNFIIFPVTAFLFLPFHFNCFGVIQGEPVKLIDSLDAIHVNWYNKNPTADTIEGARVEQAYEKLLHRQKSSKKIVVAVIDGGVDINHEDLKGKIWVNEDEIPGNKKDDDKNGYIDDVNGWNFIGNEEGENIHFDNLEYVRVVRDYRPVFKNIESKKEVADSMESKYELYLQCSTRYEEELEKYKKEKKSLENFRTNLKNANAILKNHLDKDTLLKEDIEKIKSKDRMLSTAKEFKLYLLESDFKRKDLRWMLNHNTEYLDKLLNLHFEQRPLIGDDKNDITDTGYGNNNVKGPRDEHGTFVAGIIAANRNNGIGIDGIAKNVEIMALRVVPKGDEYDKDVALSVRYAVDNGANIINMSFGKDFSPNKQFVDEAIRYAEKNNVLLVHAAGNNAYDNDEVQHYPVKELDNRKEVDNWITVGASSKQKGPELPGVFSNYGKKSVDIFAPGVNIVSLHPGNQYNLANGTSFSCPVVSGVAAMVWSYYPDLTAIQLKEVILESARKYKRLKVNIPNKKGKEKNQTRFKKLSTTGGIVDAYNAILQAEEITKK